MTYEELVTAAKNYADREDIEVSDNMDTFIIMAESRINRILKTRQQSCRAYVICEDDKDYYSLPPDYAGMRDLQINSDLPVTDHSSAACIYLSPEQMNTERNKVYDGNYYYTVIANQIQIHPPTQAGQTIEITYYRKVPNLNATDSSNWLSESHPDIYLSGMISEIEAFIKNYEVSKNWDAKMTRILDELETTDVEERWAGTSLYTRSDIV